MCPCVAKIEEARQSLRFQSGSIEIKVAKSLCDTQAYGRLRMKVYYHKKAYFSENLLSDRMIESGMEWDEFDFGESKSLQSSQNVIYIVAKKRDKVIGGARIISGKCPMEYGTCTETGYGFETGERFTIRKLDDGNRYQREISRLVIDPDEPGVKHVLPDLFRLIEHLTLDQNEFFCTTIEEQIKLYQAIGFVQIGPPVRYQFSVPVFPMMRDRHRVLTASETIPNFRPRFHERCTLPIHNHLQGKLQTAKK